MIVSKSASRKNTLSSKTIKSTSYWSSISPYW